MAPDYDVTTSRGGVRWSRVRICFRGIRSEEIGPAPRHTPLSHTQRKRLGRDMRDSRSSLPSQAVRVCEVIRQSRLRLFLVAFVEPKGRAIEQLRSDRGIVLIHMNTRAKLTVVLVSWRMQHAALQRHLPGRIT